MTIAHVMHVRDSRGLFGAERVILGLLKNYDRKRFNLSLLCMIRGDGGSDPLIQEAKKLGVEVLIVDVRGRLDFKAIFEIRQVFQQKKVAIFHSHDFKSDFYGWLASWGLSVKRVSTAHGSTRDSLKKKFYLWLNERLVWRKFHRIISVSTELQEGLLNSGFPKRQVVLVRNGLDFDSLQRVQVVEEDQTFSVNCRGKTIFAVIGRIFPDKGHIFFLNAFARVFQRDNDICALIIGDGPFFLKIKEHIEKLGLENDVHMLGVRSDMENLYGIIDCLVIPSLREGLPYVLLEAMAMEVNVIASRVGEIPKIIKDGVDGLLFDSGNSDELADAMMRYLEMKNHHVLWRKRAKEKVYTEFSADTMARNVEVVYSDLLKK